MGALAPAAAQPITSNPSRRRSQRLIAAKGFFAGLRCGGGWGGGLGGEGGGGKEGDGDEREERGEGADTWQGVHGEGGGRAEAVWE